MNPQPPRQPSRRIRAAAANKKRAARSARRGQDGTDEEAAPAAEMTTAGDDFLANYLDEVSDSEKNVERSASETSAMASLDVTKNHSRRQQRVVDSFLDGVKAVVDKSGKQKWATMLEETNNPHYLGCRRGSSEKVPRCFVELAGSITLRKGKLQMKCALIGK
jgi:hypothetical protein